MSKKSKPAPVAGAPYLSLCIRRELGRLTRVSLPLLAVGGAFSGIATAQNAPAAAATDDGLQEIVVNGYMKSLADALKAKREADITKDVIIAEDMAKFP